MQLRMANTNDGGLVGNRIMEVVAHAYPRSPKDKMATLKARVNDKGMWTRKGLLEESVHAHYTTQPVLCVSLWWTKRERDGRKEGRENDRRR